MLIRLCALPAALLLLATPAAAVQTLDFETLLNGEAGPFVFVTPQGTVNITGAGPNLGVAAFDTDPAGPNAGSEDVDLLVDTGIALILQDSLEPAMTGNIFDSPDDDADGGDIIFDFIGPDVGVLSIDLVDINGNGPATVLLEDGGGLTRTYSVPFEWTGDPNLGEVGIQTLDLTTLLPQVGVGPGNPLATAVEDAGFDPFDIDKMTVTFDGSAALDNVVFVPEPGTFALLALGIAGLTLRRRS